MRELLLTTKNKTSLMIKPKLNNLTDNSIINILKSNNTRVSIEICPNRQLNAELLSSISSSFCSVTWRTPSTEELDHVERIPAIVLAKQLRSHGYNVLLHLAGRNLKTYQVTKILDCVKDAGITNIFALQGDSSEVQEEDDNKCDFPHAADLVKFIRNDYGNFFTIGVAGYPEKHPKCESMQKDLEYLKYKVFCGADFIITQSSYLYSTIFNFVHRCRGIGIEIPIVPGIFVISSYRTLIAMSKFCGVVVPKSILEIIEKNKNHDKIVEEFGINQAAHLMREIFDGKELFGGVHVFSLNNLELLRNVLIAEEKI